MDNSSLEKILEKIFASNYFSAELDKELLKFLIDAHSKSRVLKEVDIAQEFFKRDKDFNPLDSSIVRTHMYSLRKKLETYYLSEGMDDKIRLFIPKGHYKIEYLNTQDPPIQKTNKLKPYYAPGALILVMLIALIYFWQKSENLNNENKALFIVDKSNIIWSDFLNSDLPTLLVIGDYYVYQRINEIKEKETFIRDTEINSNDDFESYLNRNPKDKKSLTKTTLTYLGTEVPTIVTKLIKIFRGNENLLRVKLSSELLWSDLRRHNIIFIGSPKTLGKMNHYVDKLRFKISLFPNMIYYTPDYKDTVNTYSLISYLQNGFHDDYAVMAKFRTSNKNTIMLIISFSSFGKTEILNELVSNSFEEKLLEQKLIDKKIPSFFEVLFKVHGIDKSGLNIQVLNFHRINSPINIDSNHDK